MIDLVDRTCNGKCSNCGECCSDFLPLSREEVKKIKKYMKTHKTVNHSKSNCFVDYNFVCPFRNNKERKCDIYEVRPFICQVFKCDTQPEKAEFVRDELSKERKTHSMKNTFFNDNSNFTLFENAIRGDILSRDILKSAYKE